MTDSVSSTRRDKIQMSERARVACRQCRLRKVRCNVHRSGIPCDNCQVDKTVCEILPRKKHVSRKGRERRPDVGDESSVAQDVEHDVQHDGGNSTSPATRTARKRLTVQQHLDIDSPIYDRDQVPRIPERIPDSTQLPPSQDHSLAHEGAAHTGQRDDDGVLLYIGDGQGVNAFASTDTPTQNERYFAPRGVDDHQLRDEDLEYLRGRGCFSLPSPSVCDHLTRCYFDHVHPFLPVVNVASFVRDVEAGGYQRIRTLVLWSMFFAASNFVEEHVLHDAGFETHKSMQREVYKRAKCLYDSDYEDDKICLVQATILLGYWQMEANDKHGAWYWIGTAISLCQTMGLHRDLEAVTTKNHFSDSKLRLFRRLWWSCVIRDRWLALAFGRPMRIQLEDCDTLMPSTEDLTFDLRQASPASLPKYTSTLRADFAPFWIKLVMLSKALGLIIQMFYRTRRDRQTIDDVRACEEEIEQSSLVDADLGREAAVRDPTSSFYEEHLQLFHQATIIVLHRPALSQIHRDTPNLPMEAFSRDKVLQAARNSHFALEKITDLNMVRCLKPLTLAALFPATQAHLIVCQAAKSTLTRKLSAHRFHLCMLVFDELRQLYWGAELAHRVFTQAEARILGSGLATATSGQVTQSGTGDNTERRTAGLISTQQEHFHALDAALDPNELHVSDPLTPFSAGAVVSPGPGGAAGLGYGSTSSNSWFPFDAFGMSNSESFFDFGPAAAFDPSLFQYIDHGTGNDGGVSAAFP